MWMSGGVVSPPVVCSVTERVVEATLPARSLATKLSVLLPSTRGMLQLKSEPPNVAVLPLQRTVSTPERASEAVPVAVTGELVTVLPSAGLVTCTVGGVLSILRVRLVVAVFVVLFMAVWLATVQAPLVVAVKRA